MLDVACGTGLISFRAMAQLGKGGRILGTDISEKMLEIASSLAVQKGEDRVQFERMDAEDLRLADGLYDAVLCALGLMYMPDPRKALQEMHRVLKPGGRAVAAVHGQFGRAVIYKLNRPFNIHAHREGHLIFHLSVPLKVFPC